MVDTSLYLFPVPPLDGPPPMEDVTEFLRECGFLGEHFAPGRFFVGEAFFSHVTFAGCSPHLQLEPRGEGDWAFTHLRLHQMRRPELRVAANRGRPRCPVCRTPVEGWKTQLSEWRRDAGCEVVCASCGDKVAVAELDWRRYGVAARLLVEVRGVWPGEAVPAETLLATLGEKTGRQWDYAWAEAI